MSPLYIENLSTAAASATKRAAETGRAAEASAAAAFDKQLRLAVEPGESKTADAHHEGTSPPVAPKKHTKPQCDAERFNDANAENDVDAEPEAVDSQATQTGLHGAEDFKNSGAENANPIESSNVDFMAVAAADAKSRETFVAETADQQQPLAPSEVMDAAGQCGASKLEGAASDTSNRSGVSPQTAGAGQDDAIAIRKGPAVAMDSQRVGDGDSQEQFVGFGAEISNQNNTIKINSAATAVTAASTAQNAGINEQAPLVIDIDAQAPANQGTSEPPSTNAKRQIDTADAANAVATVSTNDTAASSQGQPGSSGEAVSIAENAHTATATVLREKETQTAQESTAKTNTVHADPLQTPAVETHPAKAMPGPHAASSDREHHLAVPAELGSEQNESVNRVRFVQRVAQAFEAAGRDGSTLRIRLHPAELGSLRLEVAVRDAVVTARLETETQEAKHILLESLPALRERLEQQNIKIERFEIDYSGRQNDQPSQNTADKNPPHDRLQQRSYGPPADEDTQSSGEASHEPARARRLGQTAQFDVVA